MAEVPALGARGEGWVAIQFALMAAVAAAAALGPRWPDEVQAPFAMAGALAAVTGAAVVVLASRELGASLTPLPRPREGAGLVESGPYAVVRHPIYSGALLFFVGLSLALSPLALAVSGLLAVVWAFKARVEERFLRAAFDAYADYSERVRFRLVPFVY